MEGQEAEVLNALQSHATTHLHVRRTGEFSQSARRLRKLLRVDSVAVATTAGSEFVEGTKPIWETLSEQGVSLPDEVWDKVPTDLAKRLDPYLYASNEAQ